MTNGSKGSLNLGLFGIVIALASVLVVTAVSQHTLASALPPPDNPQITDLDVEEAAEAAEAKNATTAGTTKQTTTNGNATDAQFLFIQRAQSGSLSEINATAYTLELNNVSDSTILFSDRPNRIVTSISSSDFVGNWTTGTNSFSSDAPNDALIVEDTQSGNLDTAVIESSNPVYDMATNTLTYTVMAENATSIELPSDFGQAVLVIDNKIIGIDLGN